MENPGQRCSAPGFVGAATQQNTMQRRWKRMLSLAAPGARKLLEVCAGVKKSEVVLIVTDPLRPGLVAQALAAAASSLGAVPVVVTMPPAGRPGQEPPAAVAAAMRGADVVIAATTGTLFHTEACRQACAAGARVLTLTECDELTLVRGGIEADFLAIRPVVEEAARRLSAGSRIRVTSPAGTDLEADITGRMGIANTGVCDRPGCRMGFPDIEVNVAPLESSSTGRIVIDASISTIGVVSSPVTLHVEKGRVVSIEGGKEAALLRDRLEAGCAPECWVVAEIAVGLNPKAAVRGNIIEDEAAYRTGHFALGDNLGQGGANRAPVHIDMVFWRPTVEVDGKVLFVDGVPAWGPVCPALPGLQ